MYSVLDAFDMFGRGWKRGQRRLGERELWRPAAGSHGSAGDGTVIGYERRLLIGSEVPAMVWPSALCHRLLWKNSPQVSAGKKKRWTTTLNGHDLRPRASFWDGFYSLGSEHFREPSLVNLGRRCRYKCKLRLNHVNRPEHKFFRGIFACFSRTR